MSDTLEVVPLGGLGEFGMHMMAFRSNGDIIVVDAGVMFPDEELLGVDIIVPDITYLLENKSEVKAIFLTHGHEDHIGALPFIIPYLNVPIYGSAFTMALVKANWNSMGLSRRHNFTQSSRNSRSASAVSLSSFSTSRIRSWMRMPWLSKPPRAQSSIPETSKSIRHPSMENCSTSTRWPLMAIRESSHYSPTARMRSIPDTRPQNAP